MVNGRSSPEGNGNIIWIFRLSEEVGEIPPIGLCCGFTIAEAGLDSNGSPVRLMNCKYKNKAFLSNVFFIVNVSAICIHLKI
jgi:hypothetical protein